MNMIDKQEIIRAFKAWYQPGDVFEVRILDATTANNMYEHVESGYFDYDHIAEAADAIGKLRTYHGAYATVNPVNRALLFRVRYETQKAKRDQSTTDKDIVARRWLLIDCDPQRPRGISSTDEEHKKAIETANKIRAGLTENGWPDPIMSDSGNGAQLMYKVDLPADVGDLVQRFLKSIGLATTNEVIVDQSVHNAARIWRIPGTTNCKGIDDPERPHRMAKIISMPEEIKTVTREQIEKVAAYAQEPEPEPHFETQEKFKIDTWIAQYAPELKEPIPWNGGRKWIFPKCPFDDRHVNTSAVLTEQPNGAIGFTCLHNGCTGNNWHKFRKLREPGCYDNEKKEFPNVNIEGIVNQKPKEKNVAETLKESVAEQSAKCEIIQENKPIIELIPMPKTLFNVPGFIHDVVNFCIDTAPSPLPELALGSAIALQGHLAGRKVECLGGIRTNTYVIMLAPSGSGKNNPRRVVRKILSKIEMTHEIFDDTSSGQGIEDLLASFPNLIWLSDEIYEMLQSIKKDQTGSKEKIMKLLLTLHTSAADEFKTRVKAGNPGSIVKCPNLTLLGSCTTEGFFDSITERFIGHGMFARLGLFLSENEPEPKIPISMNNIPAKIEHHALQWKNYRSSESGDIELLAKEVTGNDEVMSLLREYQLEAFQEKKKLQRNGEPDWKLSLWSRAFESIVRFALIYACSEAEAPELTELTVKGLHWAHEFVYWDLNNKICMVDKYYYKTDFERLSERVMEILNIWHNKNGKETPMPGWKLNRRVKDLSPKVRDAITQSLQQQKRIEIRHESTGGRPSETYAICY